MNLLATEDPDLEMAQRFYGFGHWAAPIWFIGPEQGKGHNEPSANVRRQEVWHALGRMDLCDCLRFHEALGDMTWHGNIPRLQATWRPLIYLLLAYLGEEVSQSRARIYQRDSWGRAAGDTAVLDLSAVAARGLHVPTIRDKFLDSRTVFIRKQVEIHRPELIILYGDSKARRGHWEKIAGKAFGLDRVIRDGGTHVVLVPHPVKFEWTDDQWIACGKGLRNCREEIRGEAWER